jgi:hypothetical protein
MASASSWAVLVGSLSVFGCGGGAVSYSGDSRPRQVEPYRVTAADRAPAGLERIGSLHAGCTRVDAREGLHDQRLSDVGCSPALVEAVLRDRAASAGGTALIELECDGDDHVACSAEVWGPREAKTAVTSEPPPVNFDPRGAAAPLAPGYGSVAEAWDVRLDYDPAPGQAPREPVAPEQVAEIDFPRVGYVRLGDARAHGDARCATETLRGALRAVAARVGATSVVGIHCVELDGERSCAASLAALGVTDDAVAEVVR